ncbi:hypothetical protein ACGFXC_30225 [Streptomyces sp. NPDC048507]|uniref:hypothetical protein n=1 Tax=Streptomyces sp. NPDC048507 TaxID=3365560 RepID=UPI0037185728
MALTIGHRTGVVNWLDQFFSSMSLPLPEGRARPLPGRTARRDERDTDPPLGLAVDELERDRRFDVAAGCGGTRVEFTPVP